MNIPRAPLGHVSAYLVLTIDRDGTKNARIYSEYPLTQWHGRNETQILLAARHGRSFGEAQERLQRWLDNGGAAKLDQKLSAPTKPIDAIPTTASGEMDAKSGAARGAAALAAMVAVALVATPLTKKVAG